MEEPVDRFPRGGDQSVVLDTGSMHEYLFNALGTGSTPPLCDAEVTAPGWSSLAHVKQGHEGKEKNFPMQAMGIPGSLGTQLSLRWPEGCSQR